MVLCKVEYFTYFWNVLLRTTRRSNKSIKKNTSGSRKTRGLMVMEIPNSPKFYKPISDTAMQTPFTIYYTVECSSVPIPLYLTQLKICFPVFCDAARQRLAAWGACTSTSGKIWAGSGYTSQQATMQTTAWVPAPTSGILKTNIHRYSARRLFAILLIQLRVWMRPSVIRFMVVNTWSISVIIIWLDWETDEWIKLLEHIYHILSILYSVWTELSLSVWTLIVLILSDVWLPNLKNKQWHFSPRTFFVSKFKSQLILKLLNGWTWLKWYLHVSTDMLSCSSPKYGLTEHKKEGCRNFGPGWLNHHQLVANVFIVTKCFWKFWVVWSRTKQK